MKKSLIRNYVVLDCEKVWSDGEYVVCKTLNKRVNADGNAYGRGFIVYEVCVIEDGEVGTCVDSFDRMSEAIDYCVEESGI